MLRFLLTTTLLSLTSCATTGGSGAQKRCCLVDPDHGTLLMPNTPEHKADLEAWVTQHGSKLTTAGNVKPRFFLMYVGKDRKIQDKLPVADQDSPTAAHKLSPNDIGGLRACFRGGQSVKVDWAHNQIVE